MSIPRALTSGTIPSGRRFHSACSVTWASVAAAVSGNANAGTTWPALSRNPLSPTPSTLASTGLVGLSACAATITAATPSCCAGSAEAKITSTESTSSSASTLRSAQS